MNTILSIIVCNIEIALFIYFLYCVEKGIDRRKTSEINPMSVRTTYPAYKTTFNSWVKYWESKGIYIAMNRQHEIK